MIVEEGDVVANRPTDTADCHLISIRSPSIAGRVAPGQFVMVRLLGEDFPYLGRPFSVADVDPADPETYQLAYTAVGKGTRLMAAAAPGAKVRSVGPLGNRFAIEPAPEHVFIAGGIGVAPFPFLAREIARVDPGARRTLLLGAADRTGLHLAAHLEAMGVKVLAATDNGSSGFHGTVVQLLENLDISPESRLYACGPNPMFAALKKLLAPGGHSCQAALEEHMACGFGACNACVIPVMDPGDTRWHYELICLKGPVFDLRRILWDPAELDRIEAEATASP